MADPMANGEAAASASDAALVRLGGALADHGYRFATVTPATQARVNRSKSMATAYKVNQWPMIAVDGRFMTSPYHAGSTTKPPMNEADGQAAALKVMDFLVAKSLAEKK